MSPWIPWTGVGWLVILAIALAIVLATTPRGRIDRISRAMGLPVTEDLRGPITALPRELGIGALVSAVLGVALAFALLAATHTSNMFEVLWAYILIIFVCMGIGTTLGGISAEAKRATASVRFARLRVVTLSDYLSPLRQWGPRVVIVLLVVGLGLRALLSPHPLTDIPVFLIIYAVASVVTLVVVEVGMRRIVRRGQPAGSELELAWDDAFKGRVLYSLGVAPLYLGAYGMLVSGAFGGGPVRSVEATHAPDIEVLLGFAALGINIVVLIGDLLTDYQKRYLRRLWPEFAAQLRAVEAERDRVEAAAISAAHASRSVAKAGSEK